MDDRNNFKKIRLKKEQKDTDTLLKNYSNSIRTSGEVAGLFIREREVI